MARIEGSNPSEVTPEEPARSLGEKPTLLEVQELKTYYPVRGGLGLGAREMVKAVDDVSFTVRAGETFGLVGETGCGKTTLGRSIVRLQEPNAGRVLFEGTDICKLPHSRMKAIRRDVQMVFQDPRGSLDPRMRVGEIVAEGLRVQRTANRRDREDAAAHMLSVVGLRKEHLQRYPHEFSGGQRQRIGIARALMLRPKLVIADEAVSALDVSVQSQILNLLTDLQQEFHLTYIFIAHDLSVVEYISDRVGVMYLGKLVEIARAQDLYSNPLMPYTQALLSAIPEQQGGRKRDRIILRGDIPSPLNPPSGCRFRTRCWKAQDVCTNVEPPLSMLLNEHWVACHFPG